MRPHPGARLLPLLLAAVGLAAAPALPPAHAAGGWLTPEQAAQRPLDGVMQRIAAEPDIHAPLLAPAEHDAMAKLTAPALRPGVTPEAQAALAEKLLDQAEKPKTAPARQRVLLLAALDLQARAGVPAEERQATAERLLPLLTAYTLETQKTKAELLASVADAGAASPALRPGACAEAWAHYAVLLDQDEQLPAAAEALAKAQAWAGKIFVPDESLVALLTELERDLPREARLRKEVAAAPADPFANARIAGFFASRPGDLGRAIPFAKKAGRAEWERLAAALDEKTDSPARRLRLVAALLEVLPLLPTDDRNGGAGMAYQILTGLKQMPGLGDPEALQADMLSLRLEMTLMQLAERDRQEEAVGALRLLGVTAPAGKVVLVIDPAGLPPERWETLRHRITAAVDTLNASHALTVVLRDTTARVLPLQTAASFASPVLPPSNGLVPVTDAVQLGLRQTLDAVTVSENPAPLLDALRLAADLKPDAIVLLSAGTALPASADALAPLALPDSQRLFTLALGDAPAPAQELLRTLALRHRGDYRWTPLTDPE